MRQGTSVNNEETGLQLYTHESLPSARDLATTMFRQRWVIAVVFTLLIVGSVVGELWIPKYKTEMKILVRRQRSDAIVTASANQVSQQFSDQVSEEDLNSEVQLLNSDDMLRKVVISTGITGVRGEPKDHASQVKVAKAVRKLGKDLKFEPVHKTNVIAVSYQSHDPEMSAKVLADLATAYFEKHLQVHRSSGEFKFYDQQMRQYQQSLNEAQMRLTDFSKQTGVVSADVERDFALRQANDFDAAAHQAHSTLMETQERVITLERQLQTMQPRMVTTVRTSDNGQLLEQMKTTLLNLELKRTDLLTKFAPTYQLVKDVDRQVEQTQKALAAEQSKPVREESSDRDPTYLLLRDDLAKAQTELSGLRMRAITQAATATEYQKSAERIDENGLRQQELIRTAKTQEENYLLYFHKREEARISDALDQRGIVNVALAEEPVVPVLPVRPPVLIGMLIVLVAGVFSVSTAFMVDFMDPSFRTPDELAKYLGSPVLAALPKPKT